MKKTYKTVTGLLRYGMGMHKVAKDVAELIKKSKRPKPKASKHYIINFFDCISHSWIRTKPYTNLKAARRDLKTYKWGCRDAYLIKVTLTEEILEVK